MKKRFRFIIRVLIIILSICLISGCSNKVDLTVEEIISKNADVQKNINSQSLDMNFNLDVEENGAESIININATMDAIIKPAKYKMDFTIDLGDSNPLNYLVYLVENDGQYNVYFSLDLLGQKIWFHFVVESNNLSNSFEINETNNKFLNYELIGKEKLNNKNVYHIKANTSSEIFEEIFELFYADNDEIEVNKALFDLLVKALERLDYNMWIDAKDFTLTKLSVDGTEVFKTIMDIDGSINVDVKNFFMEISSDNINNVSDIEIPQEALEVPPIDYENLLDLQTQYQ